MGTIKLKKDSQSLKLQLEAKAFERWNARREFREDPADYLDRNPQEKAIIEERYYNYNQRERSRAKADQARPKESKIRVAERKVGDSLDFHKYPPSKEAYKFGTAVGRIYEVPDNGIEIDAFGTGFLISAHLLITNYHVLPYQDLAAKCAVNFQHEYNQQGHLLSGVHFRLNPSKFFLGDEQLDFAIVYVEPMDLTGKILVNTLSHIPLIATKGKVVLKDPINIVQYPSGTHKQYATENNFVEDILDEEGFIQYTTDTEEASSGSPAANQHWEVVALHHCGIAMTVNGKVWSRFNKPWDESMTDADKIYIANEGVSISRIVALLREQKLADPQQAALLQEVLRSSDDKMLEGNINGVTKTTPAFPGKYKPIVQMEHPPAVHDSRQQVSFNFYNTTAVHIYSQVGQHGQQQNGHEQNGVAALAGKTAVPEKKLRFDEAYSNRRYKGYKPRFLGVEIPMPDIAGSRMKEIYKEVDSNEPYVLKYYHYSLVMNKKFRLLMWSAVNVDYDPELKSKRDRNEFGDSNSWRPDPRIPSTFQITNEEFYLPATRIDRGHIVRRDDSCYGNTELEIEYANSDTFHWTNCTPQHESFNQSDKWGLWGALENAIKDGLSGEDTKASIFAGPILVEDPDRVYNDIHYPAKFWKVIAVIDEEGALNAYGFILDQSKVIDRIGMEKEAKFDFTRFKNQQVSLQMIEEESDIRFPDVLHEADIFVKKNIAPGNIISLESKDDLLIR